MAIGPGEIIREDDFIDASTADETPANNEGKVAKLEDDGKIHHDFLPEYTDLGAYESAPAQSTPLTRSGFLVGTMGPVGSNQSGSRSINVDGSSRAAWDGHNSSTTGGNSQVSSFCVPIAKGSVWTTTVGSGTAPGLSIAFIPLIYEES